jgi:hypothetical protein
MLGSRGVAFFFRSTQKCHLEFYNLGKFISKMANNKQAKDILSTILLPRAAFGFEILPFPQAFGAIAVVLL